MEFNFYEQYQGYSNVELLKILEQSENYQRAAVEAAVLVLQEREISEQERVEVSSQMEVVQQKEQVKKERLNAIRAMVTGFFEPMLRSPDEVHPVKWLNILLVVTAYQYLADIFTRIRTGLFLPLTMYTHGGLPYYFMALLDLFNIVYIPYVFYLLYKKRRWGWIILFADTMFGLILLLLESFYSLFTHPNVLFTNQFTHFLSIAFKGALLYFLWRKKITDFFGVSLKTKNDTSLMSLIGSLILLAFIYTLLT